MYQVETQIMMQKEERKTMVVLEEAKIEQDNESAVSDSQASEISESLSITDEVLLRIQL